MSYFSNTYGLLGYPVQAPGTSGLYRAQLGAIHAIASHFTLSNEPAIVTMPTGSGKTAVLMMSPYALRSSRALVITPGRLVREQIAEDFRGLEVLKRSGALPADVPPPTLVEVRSKVTSSAAWEQLRDSDVVVSTPNCVSPGHLGVPTPPSDLFDLILIDEAHHSPARTWDSLLKAFPSAKRVLFTATPFRKDRSEIRGDFVFSYPVSDAFRDGVFGKIEFVPAAYQDGEPDDDIAIAATAERILTQDRQSGFDHRLMVRTDRVPRARELLELYRERTSLKLAMVEAQTSSKKLKEVLRQLEAGVLDGVVCVNMMGEGFNFPRLKVAAIHRPHRSLAVTLQFVGRFARTNAERIGSAKFVAPASEMRLEGEQLFSKGAVWQEIVSGLSSDRVDREEQVRSGLAEFRQPTVYDEDLSDLSLYALHPRMHVKILDSAGCEVDLGAPLELRPKLGVAYSSISEGRETLVAVLRHSAPPKWYAGDKQLDRSHLLLVVYHDLASRLLFVNCSLAIDGIYKAVADSMVRGARPLSMGEIKRVLYEVKGQRVFNLGLRNLQAATAAESYRIIAGPDTQATLTASDARIYRQGHVFVSGEEGGDRVTIGYSSGSKVWAATQDRVPMLVAWCQSLARKIRAGGVVVAPSPLDMIPTGQVVEAVPDHVVLAQWPKRVFDMDDPVRARYSGADGKERVVPLLEMELAIDRARTTKSGIGLVVRGAALTYSVDFSPTGDSGDFFSLPDGLADPVSVSYGAETSTLVEFLNGHYAEFYTADGAALSGNELTVPTSEPSPIDLDLLDDTFDWNGVDIEAEVESTRGRSIQEAIRTYLEARGGDIVVFDHGSGEVADFVEFRRVDGGIAIELFHCKGSSKLKPGARLEDVYEVCGQAIRSVLWRKLRMIERRLNSRGDGLPFVVGANPELQRLLSEARDSQQFMTVNIVQPGLSKNGMTARVRELLGASNSQLVRNGFRPLRVILSP